MRLVTVARSGAIVFSVAALVVVACGGDDSESSCSGSGCSDASTDTSSDQGVVTKDAASDGNSSDGSMPNPCPTLSAGSLDPTFGAGGTTTLMNGFPSSGIALSDGKSLFAGSIRSATNGNNGDMAVFRLNADGTLDTSFGGHDGAAPGFAITSFVGTAGANAIALQSDGKIIAAGSASLSDSSLAFELAVVRYNSDGSRDVGFGTNGQVTISYGTNQDRAFGVAVKSTGEIVVVGTKGNNGIALVQLTSTGGVDSAFPADAGPIGLSGFSANAVLLDADKIVIAGTVPHNSDSAAFIDRLNADGTPDSTFIGGGLADFGPSMDQDLGLVKTSDGSYEILVQSTQFVLVDASSFAVSGYGIARFLHNGGLDPAFGNGGMVASPLTFPGDDRSGIVIGPDDRPVLAGARDSLLSAGGATGLMALSRYDADGSIDSTFGDAGSVTTSFAPYGIFSAGGLLLQADGRLVVGAVGAQVFVDGGFGAEGAFARYCP